jgi:hypothetical protein
MKVFHCDHCDQLVFFENTRCTSCHHRLAYLPDVAAVCSLEEGEGEGRWLSPLPEAGGRHYRLCRNYSDQQVCNWAIPDEDPHLFCSSCRLTRGIPDLGQPGNKEAWYRLEVAKRRLIHTLLTLRLPLDGRSDDPDRGLSFEFKGNSVPAGNAPITTGHASGLITIDVAEADDAERERRRKALHEPYRTLLGHMRHESGHYYWNRLVENQPRIDAFRELFGDEHRDYSESLAAHYENGSPADWQDRFLTAYASAHPWEDWAETWAHYLHIADTLETAAACGLSLRPRRSDEPTLAKLPTPERLPGLSFDRMMESWFPLTYVLNNLNRGLGLPDGYPFVLPRPAIAKLRFVHETVEWAGGA